MKRKLLTLFSVLLIAAVVCIVLQAVEINNIKKDQKTQFENCLLSSAASLEEFKITHHESLYKDAMAELHSAANIAELLKDEKGYEDLNTVLFSIHREYLSNSDFPFAINDLIQTFEDYGENHDLEALTEGLKAIDDRLLNLTFDKTTPIG